MAASPISLAFPYPHPCCRNLFLYRSNLLVFIFIIGFAFWIRILVSLHAYSGAHDPPHYGDYEAQRHWMEITVHTSIQDWYRNTTDNDLDYWGLDYPPLSAYQSRLHGLLMHTFDPESVALRTSRGYESSSSKLLMRWTVLSSDAFFFFPAVVYFVFSYYHGCGFEELAWALAMILLQPPLILVDHGHFQFNCISLGLTVGAVAAIRLNEDVVASILFCLALNHKQMSAYYAPAFFAHLLGKCLRRRHPFLAVIRLGVVVILTFVFCWWPFLSSQETAFSVFSRLVPLQRGIYEDYVANFWCGTSLLVKWKQKFSILLLARLALLLTLFATVPSLFQQIKAPSTRGFILAMLNSSLAFYLFSYQVHEKSILLPLLPVSLLALEEPLLFKWMVSCAMFSMFPLLRRDGLVIPYAALFTLFSLLSSHPMFKVTKEMLPVGNSKARHLIKTFIIFSFCIELVLSLAYMVFSAPVKYPYFFEALITALVFIHLVLIAIYTNLKQWAVPLDEMSSISKEKIS